MNRRRSWGREGARMVAQVQDRGMSRERGTCSIVDRDQTWLVLLTDIVEGRYVVEGDETRFVLAVLGIIRTSFLSSSA